MLAFDVNLQQSWCGEELLTLVTLMELQICERERKEVVGRMKGCLFCSWKGTELGGVGTVFHKASAKC